MESREMEDCFDSLIGCLKGKEEFEWKVKILSAIFVSSIDGIVCCVKEGRRDRSVNDSTVSFYVIREREEKETGRKDRISARRLSEVTA